MQLLLKSFVASVLFILGSTAWADCACACADGNLTTMCTTIEEAQAGTNECSVSEVTICPTPTHEGSAWSYEAPAAGATNCRDVTVWENNSFTAVKACDVLGAS